MIQFLVDVLNIDLDFCKETNMTLQNQLKHYFV